MQKVDWRSVVADLGECFIHYKEKVGGNPICITKEGIVKLNCKLDRGWRVLPFLHETVLYWDDVRVKKGGGIVYCFVLPSILEKHFSEQFTEVETTSPFSCFNNFDYHFSSVAKCTYDELINKYLIDEKTIVQMPPKLIEPEEQKLKIYDSMPDFGSW